LGGASSSPSPSKRRLGLKGARFLAEKYSPKYAFAVDSFACCGELTGDVRLSGGAVIRAADNSAIYTRKSPERWPR